ncbi:precorrin-3B synthase [Actinoplanes sp. NPDC049316]|uniref:precorrin-3B synthase n=1 Tax=Actinoplanes sp. NPDC049316 TaxID=3154727 RepID=UPI003412459C
MLSPHRSTPADACPGALRLHDAADGPLARVRIPGGRMTGAQLGVLRDIAAEWGDGHVELTSRANLQLRALTGAPAVQLAARLAAAGLLPSQTHELVRNIAASPLIGDPSPIAGLDRALCADAALAALPGRFLFAIDSGAGDVVYSADVAALPLGDRVAVLLAGRDVGLRIDPGQIVPVLLAAAHAFLRLAEETVAAGQRRPWRLRELPDGPARVAQALGMPLDAPSPQLTRPAPREPIGVIGETAAAALVPLGRLTPAQLTALSTASVLVVTPWRGIVVRDLAPGETGPWVHRLAAAGLEVAAGSPWIGVTTCAGRPGCAKALADVRSEASAAVRADAPAAVASAAGGLPVHWVGCARGCGSPAGPHVRVEATGSGYLVTGPDGVATVAASWSHGSSRPSGSPPPEDELAALVAAVRKG